jgi:peptidyl-tRNA hydrolase
LFGEGTVSGLHTAVRVNVAVKSDTKMNKTKCCDEGCHGMYITMTELNWTAQWQTTQNIKINADYSEHNQ